MRVKVRFTSGNAPVVLTLSNTDPVSSLLTQIKEKGNLSGEIEIIHSYPHKTLNLSSVPPNLPLDALPFKLDGEQLTARSLEPDTSTSSTSSSAPAAPKPLPPKPKPRSSPAIFAPPPPNDDDPPDVLLPERGTVVLRVMEDDNSCLFRAISYVVTNGLTSPTELRQIVTSGIQADPVTYNEAVLGQKVDDYCSWISMESSWGGGIELAILAKFFDVEVSPPPHASPLTPLPLLPPSNSPLDRRHRRLHPLHNALQRPPTAVLHRSLLRDPLRRARPLPAHRLLLLLPLSRPGHPHLRSRRRGRPRRGEGAGAEVEGEEVFYGYEEVYAQVWGLWGGGCGGGGCEEACEEDGAWGVWGVLEGGGGGEGGGKEGYDLFSLVGLDSI